MSAITVGGNLVHYEVLGRGRPVILVHGWLGSWRYWVPTMQQLHLKYRVYALDLFGFGDSSKNPEQYSVEQQVKMMDTFMKELAIPKAAFVGHGLGALILTQFASQNPDKVARLLVSSVPLFDPGDLNERVPPDQSRPLPPPKIIDPTVVSRPAELNSSDATIFRRPNLSSHDTPTMPRRSEDFNTQLAQAMALGSGIDDLLSQTEPKEDTQTNSPTKPSGKNPLLKLMANARLSDLLARCFKTNEAIYGKLKTDVDRTDSAVLKQSISHYDSGQMLDMLRGLPMPVVVVHGKNDPIIPEPSEEIWTYLTEDRAITLMGIPLPNVRHFPMLEHEPFQRLASEFLEAPDISKLEVKERWVRRTR